MTDKVVVVVNFYLFRVTHFDNTILVSHETLRIIYNISTMKEYYLYTTMHLKDDDTNVKAWIQYIKIKTKIEQSIIR